MLNYEEIVFRLRRLCPLFQGRVFGSAEFEQALIAMEEGKTTVSVPSAYVNTLGFECGDNTLLNSLQQAVEEAFTVTVFLDNSHDKAGLTAAGVFPIAMQQLNKALLNWEALPDRTNNPIVSKGGELIGANRSRAAYQFTFGITWYLGAEDGYEEPNEDLNFVTLEDPNHPAIGKQSVFTGPP